MPDTLFQMQAASAGYDGHPVFEGLDLSLPSGKVIAFCGPNGSGKSTALRSLRHLLPLSSGNIQLLGRDLKDWSARELAKNIALLTQTPEAPEDTLVKDLVMMGRFAHRKPFTGPSALDKAACEEALLATGMTKLAQTPIGSLSGGQAQRAWIAMVLSQQSHTILFDEPTNHLDIAHALDVLELVHRMNRQQGRNIIVVLHDLNLAARYADHVVLFEKGQIAKQGSVTEVLNETTISQVFNITCKILSLDGQPIIAALPQTHPT
ncbi:ABC transporter ATP-binding protein [Polycladidibacter hongkongensis]|uniref:ABC transporter ATP-binding protein n=1 Tax=Polycladidibacter hongkongensis TaxID=1647556 RepID=UPI000836D59B|nr:ABC transporter ATP-binding protein [Pseudovibrio hongkongensis]